MDIALLPDAELRNEMIYHFHYCYGRKARRDFVIPDNEWESRRKYIHANYEKEGLKIWEGKYPKEYEKYCEEVKE